MANIVAVLVLLAAYMLYFVLKFRTKRIDLYDAWADKFYLATEPLLKDDETPDEILTVLGFLNEEISNPNAALRFYQYLSNGDFALQTSETSEVRAVNEFFKRRPELQPSFVKAVTSAIIAFSFKAPYFNGAKLRQWLSGIDTKERYEEVVFRYRELNSGRKMPCVA